MLRLVSAKILSIVILAMSGNAYAASHGFIMMGRSSLERYVFVTQCVEGEYGSFTMSESGKTVKEDWQGYSFRNGVGLEILKFIQVGAFHTFVNLHDKDQSTERLTGSKLSGEMKFAFAAPIGNLELGGGATASRLDYQNQMDQSNMYGTGLYYLAGINYFTTSQVSVFGQIKQNQESLIRSSGSDRVKRIKTNTTSVAFGFNVWL
jgi:hypothetical protein